MFRLDGFTLQGDKDPLILHFCYKFFFSATDSFLSEVYPFIMSI